MSVTQLVTSGPLIVALPVAAAAGAITFFSPCCLPLVPGYLSFVTGMAGAAGSSPSVTAGDPPSAAAAAGGSGASGLAVATRPVTARPTAAARPVTARPTAAARPVTARPTAAARPVTVPPVTVPPVTVPPVTAPPVAARPVAAVAPATPQVPRARVVAGTALFVLGFSVVFVAYGAAFGGLGHLVTAHARQLTRILGVLTILLGLLFAGAFDRFSFAGRIVRPSARPKAGLAGAPLLGVMFGLGWTPCIGPTLTAVLALSASSGTAARGAVLAFVYALGLGVPFLLVAFGAQSVMRASAFARRHARLITRIGGAMLICVGILEVTGAWSTFMAWLQVHWLGSYQLPL